MAIIIKNIDKEQRDTNARIYKGAMKFAEDIRNAVELPEDVISVLSDDSSCVPLWCQMVADSSKVLKKGEKEEYRFIGFFDLENPLYSRHQIYMARRDGDLCFYREPDTYSTPDAIIGKNGIVRDNPDEIIDRIMWETIKTHIKLYGEESAQA